MLFLILVLILFLILQTNSASALQSLKLRPNECFIVISGHDNHFVTGPENNTAPTCLYCSLRKACCIQLPVITIVKHDDVTGYTRPRDRNMDISNRMALEVPLISARYARRFIEFMERRGVKRAALLNDTDITEAILNDPDSSITMQQITSVLRKADWLMNDERAAFQFGQQLDLPSHGLLGFAVLGQDNPRQLISMIVQYIRVGLPLMDMELSSTGSTFHIRLLDTWGLGELTPCVIKMYMGSIHRVSAEVCGHFDIQFAFPAQRDASSWQSLAPDCEFHFDAPYNQITMALKGQPTQKDNASLQFLLARNRQGAGEKVRLADETLMQVREMIMGQPGRPCTTNNIARRLDISTRTLRQHLAGAGTSFREVRNEIRKNFATLYLNDTNVPLESIAEKLGFSDQASFTKAYRAWTGQTPGDIRKQSRKTQ